MSVNFDVADAKRPILSVQKGCNSGSIIIFTPDMRGNVMNGPAAIKYIMEIMTRTSGFDIIQQDGSYVLDAEREYGS